jgi:hypothetical protein
MIEDSLSRPEPSSASNYLLYRESKWLNLNAETQDVEANGFYARENVT